MRTRINRVYVRLVEIYAYDGQLEDFKSRMQKLVESDKSKEEAVLVLALEKGLWIPEVEELLKKGMSREKAISKVAKTMKIEASTEEKVKKLGVTVKRELLELPAPPPKVGKLNKKIVVGVAMVLVVVIAFAGVFLFPRPLPEQKELDFTISGESPDVCYIPFRTGADERWNLTVECLEMPSEYTWVMVLLYNRYWDKGAGHKCDVDDVYPLATELTQLQKIGVNPDESTYYNGTTYTGIYGTSTAQSFTIFFSFPSDGIGEFHVKLEKVE